MVSHLKNMVLSTIIIVGAMYLYGIHNARASERIVMTNTLNNKQ